MRVYVAVLVAFAGLALIRAASPELADVAVKVLLVGVVYTAIAWLADVVVRPHLVARHARRAATLRGKPLLNAGAGTPETSLRARLFGPTLWGDANLDIAAVGNRASSRRVTYGDVHHLGQWHSHYFGAAIASHVLEHVEDPHLALAELHRVADEVYVITPAWWAPHTWLHPGHRWYRTGSGRFLPLRRAP